MTVYTDYAEFNAACKAGIRGIRFVNPEQAPEPRNPVTLDDGGNAATQAAIHSYQS